MFRVNFKRKMQIDANPAHDIYYIEAACVSTDTKPTTFAGHSISTGSWCHETDTKKVYAFNESANEWVLQVTFEG